MRNRAKCKLCNKIIESYHYTDYVSCECGEIAIWGGLQKAFSEAKDYANFLRVEENGKETPVKHIMNQKESSEAHPQEDHATKESLLHELDMKIKYDLSLPQHVLFAPTTTCDMVNYMMIMSAILRKL